MLDDTHKEDSPNKKIELSNVVLRAATVVFFMSKMLPWMHEGEDINMATRIATRPQMPMTAGQAAGVFKGVLHKSEKSRKIRSFLGRGWCSQPALQVH